MHSLSISSPQVHGIPAYSLWVNQATYPQPTSKPLYLFITWLSILRLYKFVAQVYTTVLFNNYRVMDVVLHTIHSPNNNSSKGD